MIYEDILNEYEQTYVREFYENEGMREAVKKIILAGIYTNGVMKKGQKADALRNFALQLVSNKGQFTNEQLGADLRALWEGINIVEAAFQQMSKYQIQEKVVDKEINEAK